MGKLINQEDQKPFRKKLRNELTPAEITLWRIIKSRQVGGMKFRRQQGIGPYVLDFYCPELRLGIELDGEKHNYTMEYDDMRSRYLFDKHGIKILRYGNNIVFDNPEGIINEILEIRNEYKK